MQPFQEWVLQLAKILSDVGVGLAGFVAAGIGFFGYGAWKREMVGKATYEVAKDAVRKAFAFRSAFHEARKFVVVPAEWSDREKQPGELPAVSKVLDKKYAAMQRGIGLQKARNDLQAACWEVEVAIKEPPESLFHDFNELYLLFARSLHSYFDHEYTLATGGYDGGPTAEDLSRSRSALKVLLGIPEDETGKAIDKAVTNLQQRLSRYLD